MDQRERSDDREEALRVAMDGRQAQIWTALPGIIESYDAATQTTSVQPATQIPYLGSDGAVTMITMPLLLDCPVQFPAGGGASLTFPVAKGDECLVIFASRCIDSWWQSGGVQPPAEQRMHDLSDGFVLLGTRSKARALANVSTSAVQLRSDDGSAYVQLDPNGHVVAIKAPGGILLDGPVHMTSTAQVDGNATFGGSSVQHAGKEIGKTHTHPNGTPNTGPVN